MIKLVFFLLTNSMFMLIATIRLTQWTNPPRYFSELSKTRPTSNSGFKILIHSIKKIQVKRVNVTDATHVVIPDKKCETVLYAFSCAKNIAINQIPNVCYAKVGIRTPKISFVHKR